MLAKGVTWNVGWHQAGSCLGGVAFWPGVGFLAVADTTAVRSDDGITWTPVGYTPGRGPGGVGPLAVGPGSDGGVAWVMGAGASVFTSPDGLTWTEAVHSAANGLGTAGFGYVSP